MSHDEPPPVAIPEDAQSHDDRAADTEVWLIRHGESEGNRGGVLQGQKDYPLSERGREQIVRLAERLRGERFAALYTSDLTRARDTALGIAGTTGLTPVIDQRLREIDIGTWSGLTPEEIHASHPGEYTAWLVRRDPSHRRGGGESYVDLQQRICPVIAELARRHLGERVLIVSHGGSINAYLCGVLGMPLDGMWRLGQENTAINRVLPFTNPNQDPAIRPGRVLSINDALHTHRGA
jgi:probable phosphoglycerate mutase